MRFRDEQAAISELAEVILDASANLYKTTKYIYSLSKKDFYSINIKDVFKIFLNNILNAEMLRTLNLSMSGEQCAEMNGPEYTKVFSLLVYSIAVRLPTLKDVEVRGDHLSDGQIRALYDMLMSKGVVNHEHMVIETFDEIRQALRKKRPIPPYSADWYKAYVCRFVPELGEINNRNLFLLGTADMLFVMFYLCLEKELEQRIMTLCAAPHHYAQG